MIVYDQLFDSSGNVLSSIVTTRAVSSSSTVQASTFTTAGAYVFNSGISTSYGFPVTFTGRCLLVVTGTSQPMATSQVLFAKSKVWYRNNASSAWKDESNFTSTELDRVTTVENKIKTMSSKLVALPLGTICMFSGGFSGRYPIPLGTSTPNYNWVICDGTTTNGLAVPDLRNRFIIGSGSSYKTGATGGSVSSSVNNHTHSVTISGTTLSVSQMPSHCHTYKLRGSTTSYQEAGYGEMGTPVNTNTSYTGGSSSHSHGSSTTSAGYQTFSIIPPYYALAYIILIKAGV